MSRKRCWDRPARGGVCTDGRLDGHEVNGVRMVCGADGVVSGATKGKLLRRLKDGEALVEYVYPEGTDLAWARSDASEGGMGALLVTELSAPLVDGRAAKRLRGAYRGRGDAVDAALASWCGGDGGLWWSYASQRGSLSALERRSVLQGRYTFDQLRAAATYADPFGAVSLLAAGADRPLLDAVVAGGGVAWALSRHDPVTLVRAGKQLVAVTGTLTGLDALWDRRVDLAAWAAGKDPADMPAPGKALAWVMGLEGASRDELRAALRNTAHDEAAIGGLAVALGGLVPRHLLEEYFDGLRSPEVLIGVSGRALSDAVDWVSRDGEVPDGDVLSLALRATKTFGHHTRTMAGKFASMGSSAHDIVASLPDFGTQGAKEFTAWLGGQELGWANRGSAREAVLRVAAAWGEEGPACATRSLREADLWVRARALLDGPASATPLAAVAASLSVPRTNAERAIEFWGGSLVIPRFAPAVEVASKDGSLVGRFLDRADPRGLFLGELTDCCQKIGGFGEDAALHGQAVASGQFFVVEDTRGQVVAQSWVWMDRVGAVCFDNIELVESGGHQGRRGRVCEIYEAVGAELVTHGVPRVTIGEGYTDSGLLRGLPRVPDALLPGWDNARLTGYTDADDQVLLASDEGGGEDVVHCRPSGRADTLVWSEGVRRWEATGRLDHGKRVVVLTGDMAPSDEVVGAVGRSNPGVEIRDQHGVVLRLGVDELDPSVLEWLGDDAVDAELHAAELSLRARGMDPSELWDDETREGMYGASLDRKYLDEVRAWRAQGVTSAATMDAMKRAKISPTTLADYRAVGLGAVDEIPGLHQDRISILIEGAREGRVGELELADLRELRDLADELSASGPLPIPEGSRREITAGGGRSLVAQASPDYDYGGEQVRSYLQAGLRDPAQIRLARDSRVDGVAAEAFARYGVSEVGDMARAGIHHISAGDMRRYGPAVQEGVAARGGTAVDAIVFLAENDVTSEDADWFARAEITDITIMAAAKAGGIRGIDAWEFYGSGVVELPTMRDLSERGITGGDYAAFAALDIEDIDEMASLTAERVPGQVALAYRDFEIPRTEWARVARAGLSPELLGHFEQAGVLSLSEKLEYVRDGVGVVELLESRYDIVDALALAKQQSSHRPWFDEE